MLTEEFNGVALFTDGGGDTLAVVTSQDGGQTIGISQSDLDEIVNGDIATIDLSDAAHITSTEIEQLNTAIQNLADLRATNGSEQSRITFAADMLAINRVNLESANSRIADVDIAAESANLARLNILQQAGTAMLAQANMSQQSILRLLA